MIPRLVNMAPPGVRPLYYDRVQVEPIVRSVSPPRVCFLVDQDNRCVTAWLDGQRECSSVWVEYLPEAA